MEEVIIKGLGPGFTRKFSQICEDDILPMLLKLFLSIEKEKPQDIFMKLELHCHLKIIRVVQRKNYRSISLINMEVKA